MNESKSNHDNHNDHDHSKHIKEEFNPVKLYEAFTNSLKKSDQTQTDYDDIYLKEYLIAYEEITKFLELLGHVFYFVISDVKEKIDILENYLKTNSKNYETFHSIIKHEKSENYFSKPLSTKQISATRHILRLHRALIFIYKFIDRLITDDQNHKSTHICTEVYEITLAKHHSWLVRKAATFGMLALPRRDILVGYMCKNEMDRKKFPDFIRTLEKAYNITQSLYEKYEILDLP